MQEGKSNCLSGYFEFRLCVNNDMTSDDEDCAEEGMLLTIAGTYGATRYDINNVEQEFYTFQLDMPRGIVCTQCILQWKYNAGLNYNSFAHFILMVVFGSTFYSGIVCRKCC
jgi:hypothetical protein